MKLELEILAKAVRQSGYTVVTRQQEIEIVSSNPGKTVFRPGRGRKRELSVEQLKAGRIIADLGCSWLFDPFTGTLSLGGEKVVHMV